MPERKLIYAIGTYTTIQTHVPEAYGKGIQVLVFDQNSGSLSEAAVYCNIYDPTYLNWDAENKKLYSITEDPHTCGVIKSFTISESLNLIPGKTICGPGRAGCHLQSYPDISRLYAAAYYDGGLVGYELKNVEPAESVCRHVYSGSGPNIERQEASHAHQVMRSPDKLRLYVCDLGSDIVWSHKLDARVI